MQKSNQALVQATGIQPEIAIAAIPDDERVWCPRRRRSGTAPSS